MSTLDRVTRMLQTGALVHRWDAAEEIVRILAQREAEYPRLVAERKLAQAEADIRNARLACAWLYTVDPSLELTGPHRYRDDLQRAAWLAEARGWKPAPHGGKR